MFLLGDGDACHFGSWSNLEDYLCRIQHGLRRFTEARPVNTEGIESCGGLTVYDLISQIIEIERHRKSDRRMAGVWEDYEIGSETTTSSAGSTTDTENIRNDLYMELRKVIRRVPTRPIHSAAAAKHQVEISHGQLPRPGLRRMSRHQQI